MSDPHNYRKVGYSMIVVSTIERFGYSMQIILKYQLFLAEICNEAMHS